ncbi:Do family serine endopeptidase [Roseateles oligotrophus]|uniref:Probable periplasmic serine endoprotease DegP-like n=1 Tax=Roseateles oligotrophus TaxID=1769250 RepID=A0ABT2YML5_9BURK|nr:Do family serine endopeptidase [Roseateles oligotrophus]MCV2371313.1 Do family serine endopeptidase [Roseateles oligotrophus]
MKRHTVFFTLMLLGALFGLAGQATGLDLFGWFPKKVAASGPAASAAMAPPGAGPLAAPASAALAESPPAALSYRSIVRQSAPAVVGVTVAGSHKLEEGEFPPGLEDPFLQFFRGLPGFQGRLPWNDVPFRSQASGFIISSDGVVLTNAHVVREAKEVTVKLSDRREFKAKVLGADPSTDVAVLRINAKNLPTVRMGEVSRLQVGDPVLAIGSPFGFEQSATQGIVSAMGRSLPGDAAVPFIQTDAAVNPGNSGGPLFDASGAVVGINAQIFSRSGGYQGLSFAIPIDVALKVKDQILATGKASHARLGVRIQELDQALAESFGLSRPEGALIVLVQRGSAAAAAGLRAGDVITELNGVAIKHSAELSSRIQMSAAGETVRLKIWRDRAWRELMAKLGAAEEGQPQTPSARSAPQNMPHSPLGLQLRPLSKEEREQTGLDGGLLVIAVAGAAVRAGLRPGDVLLTFNGVPLVSVEQLRALLEKSSKAAALLVERDGIRQFVPLELE